MSDLYLCPVCGYDRLSEPPWNNESASDEICPSCGTHFGYDDAAGGQADHRQARHRELRSRWIARGMPWHNADIEPPADGWDPKAQLKVFDE